MEILSDATFKGNVDFKGGCFTIHGKDGPIFNFDNSNNISEFGNVIGGAGIDTKLINLRCSKIKHGSYTQCLQGKDGTIALTSQVPKVFEKQLIAPADCTLFIVKPDCSSNGPNFFNTILSYRVDRLWHSGLCTLIDGCFWENTDIDIMMSNGYNGSAFVIRKAAGLAMTNPNGYEQIPGYKLVVTYF